MLHKFFCLFVLCFAFGCMKIKKKDDQGTETQVAVQSQSNENDFLEYEILEESESIQFYFPSHWPQQIIVEKYKGSEKVFKVEVLNQKGKWKDSADPKNKVGYKFFTKVTDQYVLLDEIEVLPILDLNLNQDYRLDEIYSMNEKVRKIQIRQLSLQSGAKLFIGSFKGQLQIRTLDSDNGSIQTFALGQRATEKNGRNAGGFKLDIQSATGKLNLNLIAESGAHGRQGALPDEKLTGTTGANGEPAQFKQVPGDLCGGSPICFPVSLYECSQPPKPGKSGGAGFQGYPGTDGGHGGSVEKVELVNIPAALKLEIIRVAGAKGQGAEGGAGGAGGVGGNGGDGSKGDFALFLKLNPNNPNNVFIMEGLVKTCAGAAQGPMGPPGIQGPKGRDGIDGVVF